MAEETVRARRLVRWDLTIRPEPGEDWPAYHPPGAERRSGVRLSEIYARGSSEGTLARRRIRVSGTWALSDGSPGGRPYEGWCWFPPEWIVELVDRALARNGIGADPPGQGGQSA